MRKKLKKILAAVLIAVLVPGCVFGLYAGNYYHADLETITRLSLETEYAKMERLEDGSLVFYPAEYDTGLIFYPANRVEAAAYMTLMEHCAQEGILCVLMPMPFNLPVLASDAAASISAQFPEVAHWYMAGHGQGGETAAAFTAENTAWVEGLVLLAAHAETDVTDVPVLSIYGSCDGVMDMDKYTEYRSNLPADGTELVIEGGNHAFFGVYGAHKGDGEAAITNLEQICWTAQAIGEFVKA